MAITKERGDTVDYLRRTWAEIDLDALRHNVAALAAQCAPAVICAVVKADAYGHGDRAVAAALERAGVRQFGVSNLREAAALRGYGTRGGILILGYTPAEKAAELSELNLTQTIFSREYAEELSAAAAAAGIAVDCHLKVDTGMSRLGFHPDRTEILPIYALPGLRFSGIFTHFASADMFDAFSTDYTCDQFAQFQQLLGELERAGIDFGTRHCCNSAAALRFPEMRLDMVRPGIALYGLRPSRDFELDLRPVMELKSAVSMVKTVPAGSYIGYGSTYQADRDMTLATLPIGYADGYPRLLSSRAKVLVAGQEAQVVGRVCMDQIMADVTGIPVRPGDVVTLFGRDGDAFLPVDDLSDIARTVNYETVCLIGKRVPRVYLEGGRVTEVSDYYQR